MSRWGWMLAPACAGVVLLTGSLTLISLALFVCDMGLSEWNVIVGRKAFACEIDYHCLTHKYGSWQLFLIKMSYPNLLSAYHWPFFYVNIWGSRTTFLWGCRGAWQCCFSAGSHDCPIQQDPGMAQFPAGNTAPLCWEFTSRGYLSLGAGHLGSSTSY